MDTLTQQIVALNHKVDRLYEMIIKINEQLSMLVREHQLGDHTNTASLDTQAMESSPVVRRHSTLESRFEHKDILSDDDYFETQSMLQRDQPNLTADIQIQRLTAQLTAAYNRMAALEEQLLARRTQV